MLAVRANIIRKVRTHGSQNRGVVCRVSVFVIVLNHLCVQNIFPDTLRHYSFFTSKSKGVIEATEGNGRMLCAQEFELNLGNSTDRRRRENTGGRERIRRVVRGAVWIKAALIQAGLSRHCILCCHVLTVWTHTVKQKVANIYSLLPFAARYLCDVFSSPSQTTTNR